jgi:hypothetical protein
MSKAPDSTLLKRFQPCLRYDSLECYFADSAEEWTRNPGNTLRRGETGGKVLATAGKGLSLEFLQGRHYPGGEEAVATDLIEASGDDYDEQYQKLRRENQDLRNVIYGRVVRGAHGTWLQYWFFYFFNDYRLAWGSGLHEGDWEMIQVKLSGEESEAEKAVYAQHSFCEVRNWPEVKKLAEEKEDEHLEVAPGDRDRPLVYVGRGSHASYFAPGYHPTDFYDVTDGRRRPQTEVRLEVVVDEASHPWLWWPGHWGGSRAGEAGPSAPCEHPQWDNPDSLLEQDPVVPKDVPQPDEPRLWVRRRRNRLLLEFDFSPMAAPPRRLIATVNSEDEATVAPRAFRLALREVVLGSLQTRIELDPGKHYDVSIAVIDADGRSTLAQPFFFAPSRGLLGLRRRITAGFGRLVHLVRLAFRGSD